MNEIEQYRPSFFSGYTEQTVQFETLAQLLDIAWVKVAKTIPEFYRYSLSDNSLMAEYKQGKEWYVLGFIKEPQDVNLPKWKAKK